MPSDLQDSMDYFSFDLQVNNKIKEIKKSPVDFFMGIMRNQKLYTVPKNYESPKDKALRLNLEHAKALQEKREKMESELINIEFNRWESSISEAEKDKLIPDRIKNSTFAKAPQIRGFLREFKMLKKNEVQPN